MRLTRQRVIIVLLAGFVAFLLVWLRERHRPPADASFSQPAARASLESCSTRREVRLQGRLSKG
jgi:hypothetical protein